MPPAPAAVEGFAARVKRAWTPEAYESLRSELRAMPDRGLALLDALADHSAEDVRVWASSVAAKDLGRRGVPILLKLAKHKRTLTRDAAMQDLEAVDPVLLKPFIPEMRRILRRSKGLHSAGGAAMWRLARIGDVESSATLRAFAANKDVRHYDHRMPMVLADYLDDPNSVVRRIAGHDHDWMLWLAMAAEMLNLPGAEAALATAARESPDTDCRDACAKELAKLLARGGTTHVAGQPHVSFRDAE